MTGDAPTASRLSTKVRHFEVGIGWHGIDEYCRTFDYYIVTANGKGFPVIMPLEQMQCLLDKRCGLRR